MYSNDFYLNAAAFLCPICTVFCRPAKTKGITSVNHKAVVISPGL